MRFLMMVMMALTVGLGAVRAADAPADEYRYVKLGLRSNSHRAVSYDIIIFPDGTTVYEGGEAAKETGHRLLHKSPDVFKRLSDLLAGPDFQSFGKAAFQSMQDCADHGNVMFLDDRSQEDAKDRNGWHPKRVLGQDSCRGEGEARFDALFQQAAEILDVEALAGIPGKDYSVPDCDSREKTCGQAIRNRAGKADPIWP